MNELLFYSITYVTTIIAGVFVFKRHTRKMAKRLERQAKSIEALSNTVKQNTQTLDAVADYLEQENSYSPGSQ